MTDREENRAEPDVLVVQQAQRGDKSALAQVYDFYARAIYRYHYSRTGNLHDAEDLSAQTFLALLEALPRYQHRGHFSAWIFQIARSKAMDHFRKNHKQELLSFSPADLTHAEPLEAIIDQQVYQRLSQLLGSLDDNEKELIRLRYSARLSFVEIANLLGRKEDAVRKSLKRLLERLYKEMEVENA